MNQKLLKSSILLFLITIASKVLAFISTLVFSYYYGSNSLTDAYYAAGAIPNLINNSIAISMLTLLIPIYSKCRKEEGDSGASEFIANVLNICIVVNVLLFLLICVFSPMLSKMIAPGFDKVKLSHTRNMICLLSMSFPFTVGTFILVNVNNANRSYVLPAFLTFFYNLFVIVLNVILAPKYGIYCYPFICTIGWILQFLFIFFKSNNYLFNYKALFNIKDKYFRNMVLQSFPIMISTAADQINLAADNIIGSNLSTGSLSWLGYSHRIFTSVIGVTSTTMLTIYYPIITKQYYDEDIVAIKKTLKSYSDIMFMLTLPLTILLIINSSDIMKVLFYRGALNINDVLGISYIFIIYMISMIFLSLKEICTRIFYIIGDTKTPTIINIFCVIINIVLSLILISRFKIYGIAIGTSVSVILCSIIEFNLLINKYGGIRKIVKQKIIDVKNILQIIFASSISTIVVSKFKSLINFNSIVIGVLASSLVFLTVFMLLLSILGNEYVRYILNKLKMKVKW